MNPLSLSSHTCPTQNRLQVESDLVVRQDRPTRN
jgi:hypothetical protein